MMLLFADGSCMQHHLGVGIFAVSEQHIHRMSRYCGKGNSYDAETMAVWHALNKIGAENSENDFFVFSDNEYIFRMLEEREDGNTGFEKRLLEAYRFVAPAFNVSFHYGYNGVGNPVDFTVHANNDPLLRALTFIKVKSHASRSLFHYGIQQAHVLAHKASKNGYKPTHKPVDDARLLGDLRQRPFLKTTKLMDAIRRGELKGLL